MSAEQGKTEEKAEHINEYVSILSLFLTPLCAIQLDYEQVLIRASLVIRSGKIWSLELPLGFYMDEKGDMPIEIL